jgi:hypothetical protein
MSIRFFFTSRFIAGCYDAPVGYPTFSSSARRVIARIFANGTYDTSMSFPHLFPSANVITSVVSTDGVSQFWVSGSPYQSLNGGSPSPSAPGQAAADSGVFYLDNTGAAPFPIYHKLLPVTSLTISTDTLYLTKGYSGYLGDQ